MKPVSSIQYPAPNKRVVGFRPQIVRCHLEARQTVTVGLGPHVAEEAGDGAPGRG